MQLANEIKSITEMSDEELRERLTEIRNHRLQAPEKVKRVERKKKKDAKSAAEKLLEGMTPEQIKQLLTKHT